MEDAERDRSKLVPQPCKDLVRNTGPMDGTLGRGRGGRGGGGVRKDYRKINKLINYE